MNHLNRSNKITLSKISCTEKLYLKELEMANAKEYYNLYNYPKIQEVFRKRIFENNENALQFTQRILDSCEYIWIIKKINNQSIIGDCAFHNYNKSLREVCFGGILHPDYWGTGCMRWAFEQVKEIARRSLDIKTIKAFTNSDNQNAIRFALKMGFTQHYKTEDEICLVYNY